MDVLLYGFYKEKRGLLLSTLKIFDTVEHVGKFAGKLL